MSSKISSLMVMESVGTSEKHGFLYSFSKSTYHKGSFPMSQKIEYKKYHKNFPTARLCYEGFSQIRIYSCTFSKDRRVLCHSTGTHNTEGTLRIRSSENAEDDLRDQHEDGQDADKYTHFSDNKEASRCSAAYSRQGLAEACRFAYNDAKFVNERARNDIILLSRGITRINNRARQDVAVLGLGFLKLDARAREDTEKIDLGVKRKAARLNHIATILKDKAQTDLKKAADKHWSDGALEADLRRADFVVKRRAMEDAYMALKFIQDIHDMMANRLKQQPPNEGSFSIEDMMGLITLEKNGKSLDLFSGKISVDRISAIQEAYLSMASALSEADGIDYTDPEELELLVATLIDLDAMDGKSSVSLLAECSSSPDVNTRGATWKASLVELRKVSFVLLDIYLHDPVSRKALANALATAPSMWTLGNAGMGALQRLAQDSNPAVAAAASKAINELKKQWELEEGDSLRFVMNTYTVEEDRGGDTNTNTNNT